MTNQDGLRRTGRTTRMLREAIKQANNGTWVAIFADNDNQTKQLLIKAIELVENSDYEFDKVGGDKIYIGDGSLSILHTERDALDWHTLRSPGMHSSCKVFVDHYTIESRFSNIVKELHRWDKLKVENSLYRETTNDGAYADDLAMERKVKEGSKET